jgi:hypothetical protein
MKPMRIRDDPYVPVKAYRAAMAEKEAWAQDERVRAAHGIPTESIHAQVERELAEQHARMKSAPPNPAFDTEVKGLFARTPPGREHDDELFEGLDRLRKKHCQTETRAMADANLRATQPDLHAVLTDIREELTSIRKLILSTRP